MAEGKTFKGFSDTQMKRIAGKLGYDGPVEKFGEFLQSNPAMAMKYSGLVEKAKMKFQQGGMVPAGEQLAVGPAGSATSGNTFGQNTFRQYATDNNFYATGTPEYNEMLRQQQIAAANAVRNPAALQQESQGISPIALNSAVTGVGFFPLPPQQTAASTPVTQPTQPLPSQYTPTYQYQPQTPGPDATIGDIASARLTTPGLPVGGTTIAQSTAVEPGQFVSPRAGQVQGRVAARTATAGTAQAAAPTVTGPATVEAAQVTPAVERVTEELRPAEGSVTVQMEAAEANATDTAVGTIPAAQIQEAVQVQAPQSRTLQSGELVQGAADAQKASAFVEQVQAAQADPSSAATVQGQLSNLMTQFEGGETPAWAAGALRAATAQMAARGLGSSSMAGQALVQAAMESALPIASQDASVYAKFEIENLSNKQARAMLAAEQRAQFMGMEFDQEFQARVANASKVSDIANINFNAEQQIALENARLAQTVDLNNLSNRQALVMAEAAQVANLETQNLNNRQQAAVQNAQAFLQMDFANLNNEQQAEMFRAQSRIQSLLSDQAQTNAARQFNATSENQTNQFFANLQGQISQFNAAQMNAQNQFNAGQINTVGQFNAQLQNQRDQFNAANQLVIEQSNAQWRRQVATADTLAVNRANEINAAAILNVSNLSYANLWQAYRDQMEWAWTSAENERQRDTSLSIAKINADSSKYAADSKEDSANSAAWGKFIFELIDGW